MASIFGGPDEAGKTLMVELELLRALVLASAAIAPWTTRLFGELPRGWRLGYGLALVALALGLFSPLVWLCWLWPVFCLANFGAFLLPRRATLRSAAGLARCVPFVFSLVAATWIVGGSSDLRILGYGPHFSYYAALHGNVLGWTLVGAIAALASQERPRATVHRLVVLVAFVSFLLVALGIDQLAMLKPLGVAGLTLALPSAQIAFLTETWRRHRAAFALGALSLAGLAGTMVLAWQHELGAPALGPIAGVRPMVAAHGVVNTLLVAPAFLLAVALDTLTKRD